ncbi:diguanylate cyclase [Thiomicrorhabdus aquaedulcis]|uniref:diguanylate cyclase n=1 Tax=Thiomicrorhabdus aquaedulcis TaxID=2211106 RepID=UPI001E3F404E|nr:diguanylate cyclase [Thiomicrorhabdus aquaedulcis]
MPIQPFSMTLSVVPTALYWARLLLNGAIPFLMHLGVFKALGFLSLVFSLIGLVGWLNLAQAQNVSPVQNDTAQSSTLISSSSLASTPSPSGSALVPIKFQVNWHHQFQFAGFYAALSQGYYQQAGLDVQIQTWKPGLDVNQEVVSGRTDFGVGYGSLVVEYAKGAPISLVMASFQFSPMVLLSHEPIYDLSQLSGKRIMHYGNLQIQTLIHKANAVGSTPIKNIPASGNLNDFISKKVDLYGAYSTNEPYRLTQKGVPFYIVDPKSYGAQSYDDFVIVSQQMATLQPHVVKAFKDASIKGWQYALAHPEELVEHIAQNYPVDKSKEALLAEAKATLQYVQSGQIPIGTVDPDKLMGIAADAKDIGLITPAQFKSLDMSAFIFDDNRGVFTPEELAYLAAHPVIKLGNDVDWAPFEFTDSNGLFSGMSADYFKLFEQMLGIKFEPVVDKTWGEVTQMAKEGLVDVYSCAVATPDRQTYMQFTQPYLSFPMALAGNESMPFIGNYKQLEDYTIAVVKDYWSHELLKRSYPNVTLLEVQNVRQGLEAVLDGRAAGFLDNLAVINYAQRQYGLDGIRIIGQFEERFELSIGVQAQDKVLFSILQKALDRVTEEQRQVIFNRWVKLEVINKISNQQLMQVLAPAMLIIMGLLLLIGVYAYQKRQQKAYIAKIHELSYATEIDLRTQKIIWTSHAFVKLSEYSAEELTDMPYVNLSSDTLLNEHIQSIYQQVIQGKTWQGDVEGKTKSGSLYWVNLTLTPKKNWRGEFTRCLATRVNITDKKRVEQLSITDELTGLYNRRYYNEVIEHELRRAKREGRTLGMAVLDIDLFKLVNDTYGHQHGDVVLQNVASVLSSSFHRANDFVFRMGGEEFLVLTSFDSKATYKTHLREVLKRVEALAIANKNSPFKVLTLSIGALYATVNESMDSEEMFKQADKMLYLAKEQGRNQLMMV